MLLERGARATATTMHAATAAAAATTAVLAARGAPTNINAKVALAHTLVPCHLWRLQQQHRRLVMS